jgi:hypothetical protein
VCDCRAGVRTYAIRTFVAKISTNNVPSQRLFEKLGFVVEVVHEEFEEIHLRLDVTLETVAALESGVPSFEILPYDHATDEDVPATAAS